MKKIESVVLTMLVVVCLNFSAIAYEGELPRYGMNIDAINYYTTQLPFYDMSRVHRQWIGTAPGDWYNRSLALNLDGDGWPLDIPAGYQLFLDLSLGEDSQGNRIWPTGRYRLSWQGSGTLHVTGLDQVSQSGNEIIYERTAGHSRGVRIYLSATTAGDHVRNIRLETPGYETATSLFRPTFLNELRHFGVLRFMDWCQVNGNNSLSEWNQRARPDSAFWGVSKVGVPIEIMVTLANELGKDMWINVPHLASADYMTKLAQAVRYGTDGDQPYTSEQVNPQWAPLNPELRVWVEYSNEVWSPGAPGPAQHLYARDVLAPLYGLNSVAEAYGKHATVVWSAFTDVFGGTDRVVRVLGGWHANSSYAVEALSQAGGAADVVAIAPYIGGEVASGSTIPQAIVDSGYAMPYADIYTSMGEHINGSMRTAVRSNFIAAVNAGSELVTYEGGPGIVGTGSLVNDQQLTTYLTDFHRDSGWVATYQQYLQMLNDERVSTYTAYEYVRISSKYGYFGHKEYQSQPLGDLVTPGSAHKLRTLIDWVNNPPLPPAPLPIETLVIDNDEAGADGFWPQTWGSAFYGDNWSGKGAAANNDQVKRYSPLFFEREGIYQIDIWVPSAGHRTENQPWTIVHAEGQTTVEVDMSNATTGEWLGLGQYHMGVGNWVETTDGYAPIGGTWVVADAVRFVPIEVPIADQRVDIFLHNEDSSVFSHARFWNNQTWGNGFQGSHWAGRGAGSGVDATATWTPDLDGVEGWYNLYVIVGGGGTPARTTNQPFTVYAGGQSLTIAVDLQSPTPGAWAYITTAYLESGDFIETTADFVPDAGRWAVADSIWLEPTGAP